MGWGRALRQRVFWAAASLTLASAAARAQAPGAPLQLGPAADFALSKPAKLPKNWKLVDKGREPLTERPLRMATTPPKAGSSHNAKLGSVELRIECVLNYSDEVARSANEPTRPAVVLAFATLPGVRNYKKFAMRYRFDEGPIYNLTLSSEVGNNGMRRLVLPTRFADIVTAREYRVEVDLHSAGIVYLDFDVSGADTVTNMLACK